MKYAIALTFLLGAQASALVDRQLQDTTDLCNGCQACADAGPVICDVDLLAQTGCDNCAQAGDEACQLCDQCESNDDCSPRTVAEQICSEACGVEIPEPADNFVDGILETLGLDLCFSGVATVRVQGQEQPVAMKDLKVGDSVLTEQGTYESVYAFGHYHPTFKTNFFQIYGENTNKPLEVTPSHLVYVNGKSAPVPAKEIKVGDVLRGLEGAENLVNKINTVEREGIYAPLTMGGSLLVDGVSASSYIRLNEDKESVMEDSALLHLTLSPYRLLCNGVSSTFCDTRFYMKSSGMPFYAHYGLGLLHFLTQSNVVVKTIGMSAVLFLTGTSQILENTFGASLAPLAVVVMAMIYASKKKNQQKVKTV